MRPTGSKSQYSVTEATVGGGPQYSPVHCLSRRFVLAVGKSYTRLRRRFGTFNTARICAISPEGILDASVQVAEIARVTNKSVLNAERIGAGEAHGWCSRAAEVARPVTGAAKHHREMEARCPDMAPGDERVCDTLRGPVHQAGGVVKNRLTHEC